MSTWHVVGSLNFYYVIFKNQFKQPRVMAHWYSPFRGPATTKGSGFEPSGGHVKLLKAVCHWAWLWGANGLSGDVCRSASKNKKQFKQQCMAIPCIRSAGKNYDGWPNFSELATSTLITESEIKIRCRLFRQSKTMAGQIACWQQWVEANVKKCKQF
jgi:hypothetical protein